MTATAAHLVNVLVARVGLHRTALRRSVKREGRFVLGNAIAVSTSAAGLIFAPYRREILILCRPHVLNVRPIIICCGRSNAPR